MNRYIQLLAMPTGKACPCGLAAPGLEASRVTFYDGVYKKQF